MAAAPDSPYSEPSAVAAAERRALCAGLQNVLSGVRAGHERSCRVTRAVDSGQAGSDATPFGSSNTPAGAAGAAEGWQPSLTSGIGASESLAAAFGLPLRLSEAEISSESFRGVRCPCAGSAVRFSIEELSAAARCALEEILAVA
jgi:hypothetical protein